MWEKLGKKIAKLYAILLLWKIVKKFFIIFIIIRLDIIRIIRYTVLINI